MPSLQMFCLKIRCPFSCMWVFRLITFVCFLLQQAKATAFVMSCHACIFFNHVLFAQPTCRFCLFWVTSVFSLFFLPAELDIVSSSLPSRLIFCGSLSECRKEWIHPSFLHPLPPGGACMRTLCTGGCAKTKTHKEEGGVLGESYVWVFTLLCTLCTYTLSTFPLQSGCGLHILTSWNFQVKKHIFPF